MQPEPGDVFRENALHSVYPLRVFTVLTVHGTGANCKMYILWNNGQVVRCTGVINGWDKL